MKTEYTAIGANGVRVITEEEARMNTTDNVYYLEGLADDYEFMQGKRASDEDIKSKNYFVIDLDFRNNCSFELTNEDIIEEGRHIAKYIHEEDEYFGEWSKIVFSGNGLHIYYTGDSQEFTKEEYKLGVSRIYRQWDELWGSEEYRCDRACCNIARILRLPGTVNQKNGAKVEILEERKKTSRLFNLIKAFAKKELQEREEQKAKRQKEIDERIKNFKNGEGNFYEKINSIPSYIICQRILPQYEFDGKKNFKNNKKGYTAYFYNDNNNTIVNGGSRYFDWGDSSSGWNNFSLVKHFYNLSDHETFTFFKNILGN